jgi:hypothetical protein
MPILTYGDANDARALAEIKRLARAERIVVTSHANRRLAERGVTPRDLRRALLTATAAVLQDGRDNWRVDGGVDIDGDDLMVICDLEADVIVVTVF